MYYPQAPPGRYSFVPYYIPVPSQLYPNYQVDPNHQWIPAQAYGNAPLLNGRQSETEGSEHDSTVDDDRSGSSSYPPPGVGLPSTSTMQQQPVYQMMPPFSNMYVGSIPSGMNVQGYMNSAAAAIPYPHHYQGMTTSAAASNDISQQQPMNNRGGRGGSAKSNNSTAGGKMACSAGDKGGSGGNDAYNSSHNSGGGGPAGQESNSTNDMSVSGNMAQAAMHPPHPTNFLPIGPVQYSYPYFHHQTGPPPPHMTSAQHATGSPLYIPQMQVYPHLPYSGPATVFSTDNGMPHSTMNTIPVSLSNQPANNELSTNAPHESDIYSAAAVIKEDATVVREENYKSSTSNLMADSPPFEHRKNGPVPILSQENNVSTSSGDVTDSMSSMQNNSDHSSVSQLNDITCTSENDGESMAINSNENFHPHSVSSCDNCIVEQCTVSDNVAPSNQPDAAVDIDNIATILSNMKGPNDKNTNHDERDRLPPVMNGYLEVEVQDSEITSENAKEVNSDLLNDSSKSCQNELMNGKRSNSSHDSVSSDCETAGGKSNGGVDAKNETIEEAVPATKTWASLFKPSSSASSISSLSSGSQKLKPTPPSAHMSLKSQNDTVTNMNSTYINSHSENYSSSSSNTSTYNGLHSNQYHGKSSYKYMSNSSISEDAALNKLGMLLKNYKLDHRAINFEPRGLENRSNNCYINAILQALLACPPFYNLMKSLSHNLHTSIRSKTKQHFPIIDSMVQFVDEFKPIPQKSRLNREKGIRKIDAMSHQDINPGKSFEPASLVSIIQNNSQFTLGQQEDAQEFLMCLLNGLNDEMVELIQMVDGTNSRKSLPLHQQTAKGTLPNSKNSEKLSNGDIGSDIGASDDGDAEWKQVLSKTKLNKPNSLALTKTPLSDIFRGQTRSRLQKIGDQTTSNIEPFFTLHLNIEKMPSVKDALDALFGGQSALEGVTSSRTNQEVDAFQQQTLEQLPYVLLLHLKYFDYKHHTCTKILKKTEFPIDLKLELKLISNQRSKNVGAKSRQYKLFAVVYHDGKEATKGHYITDIFHIGCAGWIRYDDSKVVTVSENEVLRPELPRVPYLLYYRRCDTIAALMQPPFEKR